MKTKALLAILLATIAAGVVFAGDIPIRTPHPIDGVWWVCHDFNGIRRPIPVQTWWKVKVHLDHGDWFTDKDGKGCMRRRPNR